MQTRRCTRCETMNPPEARFCMGCGGSLKVRCAHCQAELPAEARFCVRCGQPMGGTPPISQEIPTPSGERRIATAILADVKGSTALAERVDVETWVETMNQVLQLMADAIHAYGGEISQYRGDGLLAFFGAHTAHEDDAERAVLAALGMQEAAQRYAAQLQEETGIELRVRVGVNTGEVIATTVGRAQHHTEETAMGRAIALAARMESSAEPGTVLVTEDTYRLVAPLFEWQPMGEITVKGVSQPVTVYRPLAHRALPRKGRGIAGLASPLVGRDDERRALHQAVERLSVGVGGIVTLIGEAGIGKSRLVAEVRKAQWDGETARAIQWVEGRCLSYTSNTTYQVWLDVLRALLDIGPDAPPADASAALQARVEALGVADPSAVYPYLARVLSLPLDAGTEAGLGALDAEGQRANTFRAIETVIAHSARQRPLVVVCEDLHWADPTSVDLLVHLLSVTEQAGLLLICVTRPETDHDSWRVVEAASRLYRHRHTELWLERLSAAESKTLVGNLLHVHDLPPALCARIQETAEGNPFYVEEILRALIDSEAILRDPDTGRWHSAAETVESTVPDTLYGLLTSRIDRLPAACKRVLQMASVIGRIFTRGMLAAVLHEDAHAEAQELEPHLLALQRAQMVRERARFPEPTYIFQHHLTQEVAYRSLLRTERCRCHRRVAETLEGQLADRGEEGVELLAHHWQCAQVPAKAVHYLVEAGNRARQLGASLEAVRFYQEALAAAQSLAPDEGAGQLRRIHERLGDVYLEALSRHDEALVQYNAFLSLASLDEERARGERKVGGVHLLRGDLAQAQACFERALDYLRALPPAAETSRVHFGLAYLFISRNQPARAAEHANASLAAAHAADDRRGIADAYRQLAIILSIQGELEASYAYVERSLALYRELGDLVRTAQACNNLGHSYRQAGRTAEAQAHLDEGLDIARRIGNPRDEALLLITTSELLLDQGRLEEAIAHLERALPLAQRSGVAARRIETFLVLGVAYEMAGRLDDARAHLEAAQRLSDETHHARFLPRIYLRLATVSATEGAFERAARYVEQVEKAAGSQPSDQFGGWMHRCRAHLAAQRGDWDAAVRHLEQSLHDLERANLPVEGCKVRLSLGSAYANRGQEGDRGRACAQLRAALPLLTQIEAAEEAARTVAQLERWSC